MRQATGRELTAGAPAWGRGGEPAAASAVAVRDAAGPAATARRHRRAHQRAHRADGSTSNREDAGPLAGPRLPCASLSMPAHPPPGSRRAALPSPATLVERTPPSSAPCTTSVGARREEGHQLFATVGGGGGQRRRRGKPRGRLERHAHEARLTTRRPHATAAAWEAPTRQQPPTWRPAAAAPPHRTPAPRRSSNDAYPSEGMVVGHTPARGNKGCRQHARGGWRRRRPTRG